jgi:hypothetical protein
LAPTKAYDLQHPTYLVEIGPILDTP